MTRVELVRGGLTVRHHVDLLRTSSALCR
ncbi:putative leader peptide [Desertihabitans brevis]